MNEAFEYLLQLVTLSQKLPELPKAEDPGDELMVFTSSPFRDSIFFLPWEYQHHLCFFPRAQPSKCLLSFVFLPCFTIKTMLNDHVIILSFPCTNF